jgi:hypothetical protein
VMYLAASRLAAPRPGWPAPLEVRAFHGTRSRECPMRVLGYIRRGDPGGPGTVRSAWVYTTDQARGRMNGEPGQAMAPRGKQSG